MYNCNQLKPDLEGVAAVLALVAQEHVAVGHAGAVEVQVVHVLDALDVHRQAFQPVGQLARDGRAFDAGDLLEIGELRDLHAVAPAFPAEPPGAERRALPIVLDEADVVQGEVDADRGKRAQVEVLQVLRRRRSPSAA